MGTRSTNRTAILVVLAVGQACGSGGGGGSGHSISGTITGAGAQPITVTLSGAASQTVIAGAGSYRFGGLASGNYTVTPSLTGHDFSPTNWQVKVEGADVGGKDFTVAETQQPPAAPILQMAFALKRLRFAWDSVSGATFYKLMENVDGVSGYVQQGGDLTETSYEQEIAVHRLNWAEARYKVQACNGAGCAESNEVGGVTGMLATIGYFKASNAEGEALFGWAVALSADGNTLAVSARDESSGATGIGGDQTNDLAMNSGAVYVFTKSGAGWAQQAYVKASNTGADDGFGDAVALSADGNTLAVGARTEASNAKGIGGSQSDNSAVNAGAVYVFTRSGASWAQQAYVKASNTEANDYFGRTVALSADGNTLAVGAYAEDSNATGIDGTQGDNSASSAGAVYVFARGATNWTQQAYVKPSNTTAGLYFGKAVALSADGNTLAVGAFGISGAVYIFTRSGAYWTQQAYVYASNAETDDGFGGAVALSADGNTLAVGASGESSHATGVGGDQSDNSAKNAGAAYIFTRSGTYWAQQAYMKASNASEYDYFGCAVTLSADGNTLAVGAYSESNGRAGIGGLIPTYGSNYSGAVYTFTRTGTSWAQQAYAKASNTGAGDVFGWAVAMSADGDTLAVGAWGEASNATGIDGDQSIDSAAQTGALYLY
jgi:trimeric autotransporter adhesin